MEARLALSTALGLATEQLMNSDDIDRCIDDCVRTINNPQAQTQDKIRSACEIVGLSYLKDVMK